MGNNKYLHWLSSPTKSIYRHNSAIDSELNAAISSGAKAINSFFINSILQFQLDFRAQAIFEVFENLHINEKVEVLCNT